jgi:hypothetical protein
VLAALVTAWVTVRLLLFFNHAHEGALEPSAASGALNVYLALNRNVGAAFVPGPLSLRIAAHYRPHHHALRKVPILRLESQKT